MVFFVCPANENKDSYQGQNTGVSIKLTILLVDLTITLVPLTIMLVACAIVNLRLLGGPLPLLAPPSLLLREDKQGVGSAQMLVELAPDVVHFLASRGRAGEVHLVQICWAPSFMVFTILLCLKLLGAILAALVWKDKVYTMLRGMP